MHGFGTDKGGEGVQNPEILADVICERPLTTLRALASRVRDAFSDLGYRENHARTSSLEYLCEIVNQTRHKYIQREMLNHFRLSHSGDDRRHKTNSEMYS